MRKTLLSAAALLTFAPSGAWAQDASQNFSYSAPSGIFDNGSFKWQQYRFMEEDKERTAKLNAGQDISTGSIQGTAGGPEQYRRPGERGSRRPTSR